MPATPPPPEEALPETPTFSRERMKIRVPMRSSIATPDKGSVFGRGFLLRFVDLGGGALIFMALLSATGAVFLFGLLGTIGFFAEEQARYSPRIFPYAMGIGAVLFLLVLRALQVELNRRREGPPRRPRRKDKSEPWTWDYPWSTSWMLPDGEDVDSSILGKMSFLAFVAICNTLWYSGEPFFYIFLTFLDLIALALLVATLRKVLQSLRFRRPVVIWQEIPVYLGGVLEGRIAFPRNVRPTGPAKLTLRCVVEKRGTFDESFAVYRQTKEIPLSGGSSEPLDALSFSFKVPRSERGTDLLDRSATYWQVVAEVPVAGPDLEVAFLAPIYQKRG